MHTKGEWKVNNAIRPTDHDTYCVQSGPVIISDDIYNAEDAKLIAAAPDLLEAAKEALSFLDQMCYDDRAHFEDLEKAINKATK